MNQKKIGDLIRKLRLEKAMTQKQLASALGVGDKAVSKWECGLGCPDISLLPDLAQVLGVPLEQVLQGELSQNHFVGGNMKKTKFFICPTCGNITMCTGNATVSCCGRTLQPQNPQKATDEQLQVQEIEQDWYLTSTHPMTKENYISFVAFLTGSQLQVVKQYPEWDLQVRLPKQGHGMLLWYSTTKGLFFQYL